MGDKKEVDDDMAVEGVGGKNEVFRRDSDGPRPPQPPWPDCPLSLPVQALLPCPLSTQKRNVQEKDNSAAIGYSPLP